MQWRWLLLAIAVPISLIIEIIEGNSHNLHFLDEVIIDGLVLPVSTWVVLTFAARKIAHQFELQETLEQRQRFMQRLAEYREYGELTRYIVRYPATLLPIEHTLLLVHSQRSGKPEPAAEWHVAAGLKPYEPPPRAGSRSYRFVLLHEDRQMGVLELRCKPGEALSDDQVAFIASLAPEMALALELAIEDAREAERVYREAQIQERRRITHELHDTLAQQVFYLHLGLDQLAGDRAIYDGEATRRRIASMRDVAADVYEQVRNNLSILRAWEHVDLAEAIGRLARVTAHNADLTITIDEEGEAQWLSPHACEDLYGVAREALNNIVKHANARHVWLTLHWGVDELHMRLVDDGVGFDTACLPASGHYGLQLMREAVEAQKGELLIESAPGHGTRLLVTVPLHLANLNERQKSPYSRDASLVLGPTSGRLQDRFGRGDLS